MAHCNFCKDFLVSIYYPNHEETFFDQGAPGLYFVMLGGSFLKGALRILKTSLWQSLKPVSKFWDFIKLLGLLVNTKWGRMLLCDLKQVASLIRFVRLNISFMSDEWLFQESIPGHNSSMIKSPALWHYHIYLILY